MSRSFGSGLPTPAANPWGWPNAGGSRQSSTPVDAGEMRLKRQALEKLLNSQASRLGISDAQLNLSGIRDQLRGADDATVASMKPSDFLASAQEELRKQWPAQIQLAAMRNMGPTQPAVPGTLGANPWLNSLSSWTTPDTNEAAPQPLLTQDPNALADDETFDGSTLRSWLRFNS